MTEEFKTGDLVEFKSMLTNQWYPAKVVDVPKESRTAPEFYIVKPTSEEYLTRYGVHSLYKDLSELRLLTSPEDAKSEDLSIWKTDQSVTFQSELDGSWYRGVIERVFTEFAEIVVTDSNYLDKYKTPKLLKAYSTLRPGSYPTTAEQMVDGAEDVSPIEMDLSVDDDIVPGVSALLQELGKLTDVVTKVQGLGQIEEYLEGGDLKVKLEDELAEVEAKIIFFRQNNAGKVLDKSRIEECVVCRVRHYQDCHKKESAERAARRMAEDKKDKS